MSKHKLIKAVTVGKVEFPISKFSTGLLVRYQRAKALLEELQDAIERLAWDVESYSSDIMNDEKIYDAEKDMLDAVSLRLDNTQDNLREAGESLTRVEKGDPEF